MPHGMHLESARERRVRRLVAARVEHAAPAERVDDQRSAHLAAVGAHDRRCARRRACPTSRSRHGRGLEHGVVLLVEQRAERAVVEGGEGQGEPVAHAVVGGVDHQVGEGLPDRVLQPERVQPVRWERRRPRSGARRSRSGPAAAPAPGASGARAGQLAGDREAGKARAADHDVVVACQPRALGSPFRSPRRHGQSSCSPAGSRCSRYSSARAAGRHAPARPHSGRGTQLH